MKTEQIALYGGIGLAAYFLLIKPKTPGTTILPGGTVIPSGGTTPVYSGGTGSALVGINSGVKGGITGNILVVLKSAFFYHYNHRQRLHISRHRLTLPLQAAAVHPGFPVL
jgi:hypothetical protein